MDDDVDHIRHLLAARRSHEAIAAARDVLAEHPDHHDAQYLLVHALLDVDAPPERQQALAVAEQLCGSYPVSGEAHAARAAALGAVGRTRDAVEASHVAVGLEPDEPAHWLHHAHHQFVYATSMGGRSRWGDDVLRGAADAADRARRLAPMLAEAYFVRAEIHVALKEYDLAMQTVQEGLAIDPENAFGHQVMALAHGRRNRRAAGDHVLTAGRIDPHAKGPKELLGWVKGTEVWWVVIAVLAAIPTLSVLDGSFESWMWIFVVLSAAGAVAVTTLPRFRLSDDAEAARRRGRRLG